MPSKFQNLPSTRSAHIFKVYDQKAAFAFLAIYLIGTLVVIASTIFYASIY